MKSVICTDSHHHKIYTDSGLTDCFIITRSGLHKQHSTLQRMAITEPIEAEAFNRHAWKTLHIQVPQTKLCLVNQLMFFRLCISMPDAMCSQ